jgi:hypothetical protein
LPSAPPPTAGTSGTAGAVPVAGASAGTGGVGAPVAGMAAGMGVAGLEALPADTGSDDGGCHVARVASRHVPNALQIASGWLVCIALARRVRVSRKRAARVAREG